MSKTEFTASQIAGALSVSFGEEESANSKLHHRIRYLAKKEHLVNGRKVDDRGTLVFPKTEVYRAALYNELLSLTMDVGMAANAINKAEAYNPRVHPGSAKGSKGGYNYSGGLPTSVRGVEAGEEWALILTVARAGHSSEANISAQYLWQGEERSIDDQDFLDAIFGRNRCATRLRIDLKELFAPLIRTIGAP
jgi:hypothetical protein